MFLHYIFIACGYRSTGPVFSRFPKSIVRKILWLIIQGCRFGTMEPQVVPKGLVWCQERVFWRQIIRVG